MTLEDVFNVCRARGVHLVVTGKQMRARGRRGAVNDALKNALAVHKQTIVDAYGDGIWPDESLPDEIYIPASTPNTIEAIRACMNAQRLKAA